MTVRPSIIRVRVRHYADPSRGGIIEGGAVLNEWRFSNSCARLLDLPAANVEVEYDLGARSGRVVYRGMVVAGWERE
jgi:hypothetical protein